MNSITLQKVILFVATFIFPPLPIYLVEGCTKQLLISFLLTIFGFHFLGIIYTFYYLWPYFTGETTTYVTTETITTIIEDPQDNNIQSPDLERGDFVDESTSNKNSEPPSYSDIVNDNTTLLDVAPSKTIGDNKIQSS